MKKISWIKRLIAKFKIPKGDYCYERNSGYRCHCPYYREFWPDEDWQHHYSYCILLDYPKDDDWDPLLWDQCKCCGINEYD